MGSVVRKIKKAFKAPKKLAQKLVPKEAAGIMQMAAPFMGPVAGPVAYGLGSLKQRGRINPLGLALTMAPHLRLRGYGTGLERWIPSGYGGETQWGQRSLRDMMLKGWDRPWTDEFGVDRIKDVKPLFGDTGRWIDEKLWGLPERDAIMTTTPWGHESLTPMTEATRGWIGSEGIAGTFADEGARQALTESKLAGALLGKKGDLTKGVDLLKSVAWGSSIIGGIQAGKFKDAQEAALAAENAARAEGITDDEWLETARAEAAAYWDKWRAETTFAQGGRVGYQYGTEREGVQSLRGDQMQEIEGQMADADYYTNLYSKYAQEMIQAGKTPMSIEDFVAIIKEQEGRAQGGRVGYQLGVGPVGAPAKITKGEEYDKARSAKVRQLILEKALELMQQTEGLSGFKAMDLAEEIIKKQIFVEKGGSEYAEYISEPELEGFSMRTKQELPTGPHSDWRRFQVRDYVEDDPLLRVQTEYMHSPIMEVKKSTEVAQGGRVGYQLGIGPVGGIQPMRPQLPMNPQAMQTPPQREGGLGGLPIEADMRYTVGFMPYGEEEKADDVPARLSKNEFVFTADAVRAAGGGSVNQGAKKLYDTMKQLEAKA